ncbi:AraC family transcriptional regulator [Hymenobacter chitinivorans]|uniref:Helix-turn-helix protein n=1 Tax=Hymenobacter chitinivorans DSM 11115 TaxID=1121954 RepID=A0A2M9BPS9_9BACT|nr:helix-turn-helix domain-containing protein [Hymenobacter chitinivorans]PJJ59955.1 helix-turn-helix protein [Hymenobacter chitinivorans DSM 11115]
MHVQSFPPAPELAPYVEQYSLWDYEAATAAPGRPPVLLGLINGIHVLGYPEPGAAPGPAAGPVVELLGFTTRRQLYPPAGSRVGLLGVYLQPTGFYSLFGQPVAGPQPADPAGPIQRFARELAWCVRQSPLAPVAAAEELLRRHIRREPPRPAAMAPVAATIRNQHGQVALEDLARAAQLSRRQLERRFVAEVGITPKLYARIARFNHVFQLLEQEPLLPWPDISYQCGYFDQAHFIREFRSFTGEAPGHYLQQYHAAARVS